LKKHDAERYYKREKLRGISLEKTGYDQARALRPALILEKLLQGEHKWHQKRSTDSEDNQEGFLKKSR